MTRSFGTDKVALTLWESSCPGYIRETHARSPSLLETIHVTFSLQVWCVPTCSNPVCEDVMSNKYLATTIWSHSTFTLNICYTIYGESAAAWYKTYISIWLWNLHRTVNVSSHIGQCRSIRLHRLCIDNPLSHSVFLSWVYVPKATWIQLCWLLADSRFQSCIMITTQLYVLVSASWFLSELLYNSVLQFLRQTCLFE